MLPQNKRPSRLPPAPPATASHRAPPPAISRRSNSVVPPAPVPSRARSYQPPPPAGDDARTQVLPASVRAAVASVAPPPQARPSRPLLDFTASDDDDEDATRLFESGRNSARPSYAPPPAEHHTLPAAGMAGKKTLSRNPAAVEDDIQARALLAGETGENPSARARKPVQPAQNAARRESTPPPAAVDPSMPMGVGVVMPSRRPPRSATSTASAFQRTEAEPAPPFAPSARALSKPAVQPIPSTAASLPAATWSASGEQVAAIVSTMPARRMASWFVALGAAVALVVVGSTVFLRNPSTAMAASALADPVAMATAGQPSADLPELAKAPSSADLPASVAPPTPPPIPVDHPAYVPGSAAPEPVAVAPAPEPPAEEKPVSHRHAAAAPAPAPKAKPDAPKPVEKPAKPAEKVEKKVAAAPAEPKKKSGKGEQSDDERRASEEAKRLAQKQLEDQL